MVQRKDCTRDEKGRFVPVEKTILIDEFGDLGSSPDSSKKFGMVATVTRDPGTFRRISERKKRETNTKGELKYRNSNFQIRQEMIHEISRSDVYIYATIANKNPMSGKKLYKKTAESLLHDIMNNDSAKSYYVIYDRHSALNKDAADKLTKSVASKHHKFISEVLTLNSSDSLELQTHDFVAGALGADAERGDSRLSGILNNKLRLRIIIKM